MKPLCIYHGNCADGFGAAWAVREALGHDNVDFHAGIHQDPPPDVAGRDVIMVDFAYKRPVLLEMGKVAHSLLILDHHKSAAEDLEGLGYDLSAGPWDSSYEAWIDEVIPYLLNESLAPVGVLFDMERSGAGIAWDFFHAAARPGLIDHIEDRDLWRFALPGTRAIQAAVFSYDYDFNTWDWLMLEADPKDLAHAGRAIERKHHKDVAELVKVCKRYMVIAGHEVPIASLPYTLTSDAGHLMCQPHEGEDGMGVFVPPFAACYWDTPDGRVFSLRSDDRYGNVDVSEIATQYGGGGHRNAAGFRVPRDHELAQA